MSAFSIVLAKGGSRRVTWRPGIGWSDDAGNVYPGTPRTIDLLEGRGQSGSATAEHYTKQWGSGTGYVRFIQANPDAARATMARQLLWPELLAQIRRDACSRCVRVYDAACGFGSVFKDLYAHPAPCYLRYLGADIHHALAEISWPEAATTDSALLMRWDISEPPPVEERFDYVICRAAIHHTPNPQRTFGSLVQSLNPGGRIAISVYTRKARPREACDEVIRNEIRQMSPEDALSVARQFSQLGKDLQQACGQITVSRDLPFLRIEAGTYRIHEFIYDHFLKCWYNQQFGLDYSDIVNFDWYHPEYAYRYDIEEIFDWFRCAGVTIEASASNKAQHFVQGRLR